MLFVSTYSSAQDCDNSNNCVEQGQWQVGVAFGAGVITNPLVEADNIPLVVQMDLAWYGENAYFDNGELGYIWHSKTQFDVSTYLSIDREKMSFTRFGPGNIFAPTTSPSDPNVPVEPDYGNEGDLVISSRDIANRKWAILLGNRLRYFGENFRISLALETDISSVHKGQRLALEYQRYWLGKKWRFSIAPSLNYQSDNLTNYYYGLSDRDQVAPEELYQAKGGLQPKIALQYTYQLSERWYFISYASYRKLHSGMYDSPIVNDNNITSIFIGAGYRY